MSIYLPIAEITVNFFYLMGLGALVGTISGLFGVGGGFLLTPFLMIYGVPSPVAVASVTAQVVASSTSGTLSHLGRKTIDLKLGALLVAGGSLGAVLGVVIFDFLQSLGQLDVLLAIGYLTLLGSIGTLMLVESTGLSLRRKQRADQVAQRRERRKFPPWIRALPFPIMFRRSGIVVSAIPVVGVGFVIGVIGAILGIGGGFILVPALVYLLHVPGKYVVGTSLLHLTAVMAVTCTLHALHNQSVDLILAFSLMIGGVFGAQVGASMGTKLDARQLRLLLALIVLAVAGRFAYGLMVLPEALFQSIRIDAGMIP